MIRNAPGASLFRHTLVTVGIEFESLSEQVDTSTPTGRMVFTVLGAVAELERSLIVEGVKADLRNAKAKGKRLGRPPVKLDPARVARLRAAGVSWQGISRRLGVGIGTLYRLAVNSHHHGFSVHSDIR